MGNGNTINPNKPFAPNGAAKKSGNLNNKTENFAAIKVELDKANSLSYLPSDGESHSYEKSFGQTLDETIFGSLNALDKTKYFGVNENPTILKQARTGLAASLGMQGNSNSIDVFNKIRSFKPEAGIYQKAQDAATSLGKGDLASITDGNDMKKVVDLVAGKYAGAIIDQRVASYQEALHKSGDMVTADGAATNIRRYELDVSDDLGNQFVRDVYASSSPDMPEGILAARYQI